jgi:hypothetical protein
LILKIDDVMVKRIDKNQNAHENSAAPNSKLGQLKPKQAMSHQNRPGLISQWERFEEHRTFRDIKVADVCFGSKRKFGTAVGMSALGHNQTLRHAQAMSALPATQVE